MNMEFHKNQKYYLLVLVLSYLILITSCSNIEETEQAKTMKVSLNKLLAENQNSFDLQTITGFEWDKVCVLSPYSVYPGIENEKLTKLIDADIENYTGRIPEVNDDSLSALVFIQNNQIIEIVQLQGFRFLIASNDKNCFTTNATADMRKNDTLVDITIK